MRKQVFALCALFCVFPICSSAQDPAAQAAQQAAAAAMQQAQAATAEAMRQSQDAAQQAAQQSQQAAMNAANAPYVIPAAATPSISKKSGSYNSPFIVRLKSSTRGAVIYYTTDGWTPTVDSLRYTGPISIDSSTKLQAIAVAPNLQRSLVASAQFTFPMPSASATAAAPLPTPFLDPSGKYILPCDTPIHLVFSEDVNEKKAEVGDRVPMILAEDFAAGDMVFAKKG
ncbi:MAG TPA: chitobiase/beta-hexosaminidase C-terminal domain-containing protein, partial [Candidatus Eremiobacteraceae bacterium]|nr:chitobiase/beta-hexosaminidase C-terminal domain-containing protein [Candidatus Eremiobacteraceae bacterium]